MIETPNKILIRTILHAKPHNYRIIMPTLILCHKYGILGVTLQTSFPLMTENAPP